MAVAASIQGNLRGQTLFLDVIEILLSVMALVMALRNAQWWEEDGKYDNDGRWMEDRMVGVGMKVGFVM